VFTVVKKMDEDIIDFDESEEADLELRLLLRNAEEAWLDGGSALPVVELMHTNGIEHPFREQS
jgi:hypothetical protein